jgi:hypothetical protein
MGFRDMWNSGGVVRLIVFAFLLLRRVILSRILWLSLLCGAGVGLAAALGSIYAIGWHNAWKVYRFWFILSPLLGPLAIAFAAIFDHLQTFSTKITNAICGFLAVLVLAVFMAGGYEGARSDYPLLISQNTSLEELSKAVAEQTRNLGGLSESGTKLVNQLNSTETQLETAKKQLAVTLGAFDAQRRAAQQVTDALKQLDDRQKQIALQTEELERILGGQQPITRHDLQRANNQGLVYGLVFGFVTSLFASVAYNALKKRKVFPE